MLWMFVGPTGVYLLDFFSSGIQFYGPILNFHSHSNSTNTRESMVGVGVEWD